MGWTNTACCELQNACVSLAHLIALDSTGVGLCSLQNQNAVSENTSLIGKVPSFWNVKRPKHVAFSVLLTSLLWSEGRADNQHVYVAPYLWLQWNILQSKSQNLEICSWWKQDIHSQIEIKVTDVNKKKALITSNLFSQARDLLSVCDLIASYSWNRDYIWLLLKWETSGVKSHAAEEAE